MRNNIKYGINIQEGDLRGREDMLYPNIRFQYHDSGTYEDIRARTYVRTLVEGVWYAVPITYSYVLDKGYKGSKEGVLKHIYNSIITEAYKVQLLFEIPSNLVDHSENSMLYVDRIQISEQHRLIHGYPGYMENVVVFNKSIEDQLSLIATVGTITLDINDLNKIKNIEYEI